LTEGLKSVKVMEGKSKRVLEESEDVVLRISERVMGPSVIETRGKSKGVIEEESKGIGDVTLRIRGRVMSPSVVRIEGESSKGKSGEVKVSPERSRCVA